MYEAVGKPLVLNTILTPNYWFWKQTGDEIHATGGNLLPA
jgi:hypothetical protein